MNWIDDERKKKKIRAVDNLKRKEPKWKLNNEHVNMINKLKSLLTTLKLLSRNLLGFML